MKDVLESLYNVPVSTKTIASLYPGISGTLQKVSTLEHEGKIIRLKRGLYVVNPKWNGQPVSLELIANHIYSPSYVSKHTALRYYGLIPERVNLIQSMTLKHTRKFENTLGIFEYTEVDKDYFPIGLHHEEVENAAFVIASPEKALCDLIAFTPGITLRYIKEARALLEEDFRLDMDAFRNFDKSILRDCARTGKKSQSIQTLIKLLER